MALRRSELVDVRRRDGRVMEAIVGCCYSWRMGIAMGGEGIVKVGSGGLWKYLKDAESERHPSARGETAQAHKYRSTYDGLETWLLYSSEYTDLQ
jgi:hypothetical protein